MGGARLLNNKVTNNRQLWLTMNTTQGSDICDQCQRGRMVRKTQQIAFHQWTDKGYVACEATIPMLVCDACGAKTWDDDGEAIIEQAVKEAYDKLT